MMDDTVEFRAARPVDADGVHRALVAAAEEEGTLIEAPDEQSVEHIRGRIRQCIARRNQFFHLAARDGQVVGMVALEILPLRALQHIRQLSLIVDPRYRRRGIGGELLRHAMDWARDQAEVEKIEVRIRETNIAGTALAAKAGFALEGRLKRHVGLANGRRLDDLEMALFVDSPPPKKS